MLPKKYRLPIQLFPRAQVSSVRNTYFVVKTSNNTLSHPRFGVLVSKGVAKEATRRNALRRDIFRFLQETKLFSSKVSRDVLFIPSPSALSLSREELSGVLRGIFSKL